MRRTCAVRLAAAVLAAVAIPIAGCSPVMEPEATGLIEADMIEAQTGSGITFIRMKAAFGVSMSALFEGPVVADDQGCLRLDNEDHPTVVWPKDYDFDTAGGQVRILDATGEPVGRVGESFRLGGGEVPSLHDGLGFSDADRELASDRCPGRYWIVGTD